MPLGQFNERVPVKFYLPLTNANGTSAVVVVAGGFVGTFHLDHIWAINTDSIDHAINVYWVSSATLYLAGRPNVPSGSGTAGANATDLLTAMLPSNQGVDFVAGEGMEAAAAVTINSPNGVTLVFAGGYY